MKKVLVALLASCALSLNKRIDSFLFDEVEKKINETYDLISNETFKKIIKENYLSGEDEIKTNPLKKLVLNSTRKKNDISSYYSCTKGDEDHDYDYYVITVANNFTNKTRADYVKDSYLFFQKENYTFGICLLSGSTPEDIKDYFYKLNENMTDFFEMSGQIVTVKSLKSLEEVNLNVCEKTITIIVLVGLGFQIIFLFFNIIPEGIFMWCFRKKAKNLEPLMGDSSEKISTINSDSLSEVEKNKYETDRIMLFKFLRCFNFHESWDILFNHRMQTNNMNEYNNDNGLGYIKGLRGLSMIMTLYGASYIMLMNYSFKNYEPSIYESYFIKLIFGFIIIGARISPRILFSCSGFSCAYKLLCFLEKRLLKKGVRKVRSKEDITGNSSVDKSNGTITRISNVKNFNEIFSDQLEDQSRLTYTTIVWFYLSQSTRYLLSFLVIFMLKTTFFGLFSKYMSPSLLKYKYSNIDSIEYSEYVGYFLLYKNFFFEGEHKDGISCILPLAWQMFNEFFFFFLTVPFLFILYKNKKCLVTWVFWLMLILFLVRIFIYALMNKDNAYSTLFYYQNQYFGAININPIFNYSFYLCGVLFGIINYILQRKEISEANKSLERGLHILTLIKYQNNCLFYIIFLVSSVLLFVISFSMQIVSAIIKWFEDGKYLEYLFKNRIFNWFYIFDEFLVCAIVHFILFSLYVKGKKLFSNALTSQKWTVFSNLYFPFLIVLNVVLAYVYNKSETRIPLEITSIYFYGTISGIVQLIVLIIYCVFFDIPFRRLNYFFLHK